tara:strand:+ start:432 stop:1511 length:1080 start_codon:yes stop_codon:yes gene_type:complete
MIKKGKKYISLIKILSTNISLLILGLVFIELFFKFSKKEPLFITSKYPIPKLKCNINYKYDVSHLYNQKETITSSYIRNKECYRSYKDNLIIPKILTIGGSTTDQIYVTEGKTFQDLLDLKFQYKFDFINGGVDGQSSSGHLFSIINWHSKALKKELVDEIIFYIGSNDRYLFKENKKFNLRYNLKRRLLDIIDTNSQIYRFIKHIYISREKSRNFDFLSSHSEKFKFINTKKISYIDPKLRSKNYEEGIKELISRTINLFPYSSIRVIQQQIPGCEFHTQNIVIDRFGENSAKCKLIGGVYLGIDNAIENLSKKHKSKVSVHKMYLLKIIEDEDVYDALHTNNNGSKKISEYIYSLYK